MDCHGYRAVAGRGAPPVNDEELLRYSRHIMLDGWDIEGQERVMAARVLLVGVGGLGSAVGLYLAAAGVGELVLADDDAVDVSNLQRQIAHTEANIGVSKVESGRQAIHARNHAVSVSTINERLTGEFLKDAVSKADVVVDACDNYETRFALNRATRVHGIPLVSGAAIRSEGQLSVFDGSDPECPCYECLYRKAPEQQLSCSESGVVGPLVGVIGSLQALETLKVLSGFGTPLRGRLLLLDAMTMEIRTWVLPQRADCPVCGTVT